MNWPQPVPLLFVGVVVLLALVAGRRLLRTL
jgi:hypothetical protein